MYTSRVEKRSSKVSYSTTEDGVADVKCQYTNLCSIIGAKIPARLVLYFLSWSGFLVSFIMRNDINFALTKMIRDPTLINATNIVINDNVTSKTNDYSLVNGEVTNSTAHATDSSFETYDNYDWSTTVKSVIISSFYWCYVLSQIVGGVATQYFGTKHVFGWSQFATAVCSLCIPTAANIHYGAVIFLRSVQGFASGLTWPAMYAIVGSWIPLSERSRFMSSFQGFSIGIGLTYVLCGFLINNFHWRYVFYTTGSLGLFWCILWYFLAFNTPRKHPRITSKELEYIEGNVSSEFPETLHMKVPWQKLFNSMPVWAIAITTFGRIWIHYIFIIEGPNFIKNILEFNYQANGFLSGMPFICSYISSVFFCYAADKIVMHQWISLTNIRKIFTALSQIIPGILLYCIGYIDYNIPLLLVIWFVAVTFITASYAGAMANIVDIAPNLAGSVLAFCQTIHMSASFLSPLVSGLIVTNVNSICQWRTNFAVSSVISILTYIVYQIYGTAEIQEWNFSPRNNESAEESQVLNKQSEEPIPKNI